jgi:hypothetical protein
MNGLILYQHMCTERCLGKHHSQIRDALSNSLSIPFLRSYKVGREVLHSILGSYVIAYYDRHILCFNTDLHLTGIARPGVAPIVWETKARIDLGCKTVLDPIENAEQKLLMDFIGMYFKFWDIL